MHQTIPVGVKRVWGSWQRGAEKGGGGREGRKKGEKGEGRNVRKKEKGGEGEKGDRRREQGERRWDTGDGGWGEGRRDPLFPPLPGQHHIMSLIHASSSISEMRACTWRPGGQQILMPYAHKHVIMPQIGGSLIKYENPITTRLLSTDCTHMHDDSHMIKGKLRPYFIIYLRFVCSSSSIPASNKTYGKSSRGLSPVRDINEQEH